MGFWVMVVCAVAAIVLVVSGLRKREDPKVAWSATGLGVVLAIVAVVLGYPK